MTFDGGGGEIRNYGSEQGESRRGLSKNVSLIAVWRVIEGYVLTLTGNIVCPGNAGAFVEPNMLRC